MVIFPCQGFVKKLFKYPRSCLQITLPPPQEKRHTHSLLTIGTQAPASGRLSVGHLPKGSLRGPKGRLAWLRSLKLRSFAKAELRLVGGCSLVS